MPCKTQQLFKFYLLEGEQLHKALENGVSQYPKLEGRFPQVSGMTFVFDPDKPPGQRVNPKYIKIGDEYLDFSQVWKLVVRWEKIISYNCYELVFLKIFDEQKKELI